MENVLLNWQSQRMARVNTGALATEILALSDAVNDVVYCADNLSSYNLFIED